MTGPNSSIVLLLLRKFSRAAEPGLSLSASSTVGESTNQNVPETSKPWFKSFSRYTFYDRLSHEEYQVCRLKKH